MRFAFSTLGVPGMDVADVAELAAGSGYEGVELRVAPDEPVHTGLGQRDRARVAKEFERAGVEVLAVCGYTPVAAEGDDEPVLREIGELLWLARDLGASAVRVFPGGEAQSSAEEEPGGESPVGEGPDGGGLEAAGGSGGSGGDAIAARRLGAAAETGAGVGVRILLETHDSHPTGAAVSRVLGPVGHRHAGAIWDVLHPWLGGEEPAATHAALAPFLGYVQVKDVASYGDLTPLPLGAGALPLAECLATLAPGTWVSWEYEKRWHPGAAELSELLVPGRLHLEALLAAAGSRPPGPFPA